MQELIGVNNIYKNFGLRSVLRDVNLAVHEGEVLAIMGPNGAGKTTLLRILAALSRPDRGEVFFQGRSIKGNEKDVRRKLGVVLHQSLLYFDLSAEENLQFYAHLYGVADSQTRVEEIFERIGLVNKRKQVIRTLSRGMQQRLAVGRALINDPEILLMDEPHTGLDSESVDRLDELIRRVSGDDRAVIMVTHDFTHVMSLASRIALLDKGRVIDSFAVDGIDQKQLEARYQDSIGKTG